MTVDSGKGTVRTKHNVSSTAVAYTNVDIDEVADIRTEYNNPTYEHIVKDTEMVSMSSSDTTSAQGSDGSRPASADPRLLDAQPTTSGTYGDDGEDDSRGLIVYNSERRRPSSGKYFAGIPRYQRRLIGVIGVAKVALASGTYIVYFTHRVWTVPDCDAPRDTWPAGPPGSITTEWGLACGRAWELADCNSAFFAGCLLGALAGGMLVDRFGRRPVALGMFVLHTAALGLSAVAPGVWLYALARMLAGVGNIAAIESIYILGMEWVPDQARAAVGGFFFTCTSLGNLFTILVAFALAEGAHVPGWRQLTGALAGLSALPLLLLVPFLAESPRWQQAQGRHMAAFRSLQQAAEYNHHGSPPSPDDCSSSGGGEAAVGPGGGHEPLTAASLAALVRQRRLVAMAALWFVTSAMFYGISLSNHILSGGHEGGRFSIYINATSSSAADVLAAVLSAWALSLIGRRSSTALFYLAGGGTFFLLLALPSHLKVLAAVVGKLFFSAAYDNLYVYTAELFVTSTRGTAMGMCSCAARVGSILAPQVLAALSTTDTMLMFGVVSLVAALNTRFMLPDTRIALDDAAP